MKKTFTQRSVQTWRASSLAIIIILFTSLSIFGQKGGITIGTGTVEKMIPVTGNWQYSYSQSIYHQEDIGSAISIPAIAFDFTGSSFGGDSEWEIYMGHTTKDKFNSTNEWVDNSTLTKVYDATFSDPTGSGWLIFDITDFDYNGTDNLVIAVNEKKSGYQGGGGATFNCTNMTTIDDRCNIAADDNNLININNPGSGVSSMIGYYPNLRIVFAASTGTDITAFSFAEQTGAATFDDATKIIDIEVPYGTNLTSLVSTFTLSDNASATVGGTDQVSGTTTNNFTDTVEYLVTAEDGSTTQIWKVKVSTVAANTETDILTFSIPEEIATATIANNIITIEATKGSDLTDITASFSLSFGAVATVGGTTQVSGTTSNNFTDTVEYLVTAEDGIANETWKVTVFVSAVAAKWADNGKGGDREDLMTRIDIDSKSNVYGIGIFISDTLIFGNDTLNSLGTSFNTFLVKYDSDGVAQWAKGYGHDDGNVSIRGIVVDNDDNVIICGHFNSSELVIGSTTLTKISETDGSNKGGDLFIAKLDFAGNLLWADNYGDATSYTPNYLFNVAVDNNNNIYALGTLQSIEFDFGITTLENDYMDADVLLLKFSSDGTIIRANNYNADGDEWARGIACDNNDNVVIQGYFKGSSLTIGSKTVTGNDVMNCFIAKLDSAGNALWAKTGGSTDNSCEGEFNPDIAIDDYGNIYTRVFFEHASSFTFGGFTVSRNYYGAETTSILLKLDADGNTIWANSINSPVAGNVYESHWTGIAINPDNEIIISGAFYGDSINLDGIIIHNGTTDPLHRYTPYLIKYSNNGHPIWATTTTDNSFAGYTSVRVDEDYNIFAGGSFLPASITIDNTTLTSSGQWDAFVSKRPDAPSLYSIVFETAGGLEADITFDGYGTKTATGGFATFDDIPPSFQWIKYTASHNGYGDVSDSIQVLYNDTVIIPFHITSTEAKLLTFSIPEQVAAATIDTVNRTVSIDVPYGTNVTALVPTFTLSEYATATVGVAVQVSGTTSNDFTNTVNYLVTAEDTVTSTTWAVTVTVAAYVSKTGTDILTFSVPEQMASATINSTLHTVAINVPYSTDLTALVASFTLSDSATATIGSTAQVSGTTANDFTNTVDYTVTAEDGTIQLWAVTITLFSTENDFLTFSVTEQDTNAVVDAVGHTISVRVPQGTDVTALTPTFTLSAGAVAKINGVTQVSGSTSNNFSSVVYYIVTASDGSTAQIWTATVGFSASINELDESAFQIYPNPSNGEFTITMSNIRYQMSDVECQITDITGQIINTQHSTFNTQQLSIDISNQPKGMYFIKISTNEGVITKKIVIK